MLHHCLADNDAGNSILNIQHLLGSILDICKLMLLIQIFKIKDLLKTFNVLNHILLHLLVLAALINVGYFLVDISIALADVEYVTDLFNLFDTLHLLVIVGVQNLNFVSRIYEEVLVKVIIFIFLVLLLQNYNLGQYTSIVVPNLLENVSRQPRKYSDSSWVLIMDFVLNLDHGKHVLDDENDCLQLFWVFSWKDLDVVNDLELSVNIIDIVIELPLLLVGCVDVDDIITFLHWLSTFILIIVHEFSQRKYLECVVLLASDVLLKRKELTFKEIVLRFILNYFIPKLFGKLHIVLNWNILLQLSQQVWSFILLNRSDGVFCELTFFKLINFFDLILNYFFFQIFSQVITEQLERREDVIICKWIHTFVYILRRGHLTAFNEDPFKVVNLFIIVQVGSIVQSEFVEVSEYLFYQDRLILLITFLIKELNGLYEKLHLFNLLGGIKALFCNWLLPFRITDTINTTLRVLALAFCIRLNDTTHFAGAW